MITRDLTRKLASLARHIDELFEATYDEAADKARVREYLRAMSSACRRALIAESTAVGNGGASLSDENRMDFDGLVRKLRDKHREAAHKRDLALRQNRATRISVASLAERALSTGDPLRYELALKSLVAQAQLVRVIEAKETKQFKEQDNG